MIINKFKSECCGCTACENICPQHAISMQADDLGFLYPHVDDRKCINCHLCIRICPFKSDSKRISNQISSITYAVKHKNTNEVESSQSGAAFIALSDRIIEEGGIVYGVGYTNHFRVTHKKAQTITERNEFKGSKYVQSNLDKTFLQIKKDLTDGLKVMFTGTPCQTAGLLSYIDDTLQKNLFIVDCACHGVASPSLWRDYIAYLEKKEKQIIETLQFRDKKIGGWKSHIESFKFKDGKTRTYSYLFYTSFTIRESCFKCPFTNLQRPSDITIADFWGIENTRAARLGEDNKGCSLVILNSEKGKEWFNSIKEDVYYIPVDISDCLQPNLKSPTPKPAKRDAFEYDYIHKGFEHVMYKYGSTGWKYRLKVLLSRITPKFLKQLIKKKIKYNENRNTHFS